jgi:pimeloyl-ACP methyl ester carboxylesterase
LITVDNGRRLAELIPAARYVELSGVGHLVAHEAGDALIDALTQ